MKVVSLVPSWTETLLEAGIEVVGRTRFCIHPSPAVDKIPAVGGTKDVDWDKVKSLQPDLVIMDREENTKSMAESCPLPWLATHVTSMADLPREFKQLGDALESQNLLKMGERWQKLNGHPPLSADVLRVPGLIKWIRPMTVSPQKVVYVIWAKPWMAAGRPTFIGSVFEWLGWSLDGSDKYPTFDPQNYDSQTLFLCSSEPYPFAKKTNIAETLPGAVALVDGEVLSWFGVRSLKYLESKISK